MHRLLAFPAGCLAAAALFNGATVGESAALRDVDESAAAVYRFLDDAPGSRAVEYGGRVLLTDDGGAPRPVGTSPAERSPTDAVSDAGPAVRPVLLDY